MASNTVRIAILASAAGAVAGFNQAATAAEGMQTRIGRVAGAIKGALVGGAIGEALDATKQLFSDAFADASTRARDVRVLGSQITNMGAAGRKAFAEAGSFAEEFGRKAAIPKDRITEVQTVLSSFPGAFRQGSLGADAMSRATRAAFDLAAAGIGDAHSNAIQLGKALDDPVKGLTALHRAGVTFSQDQQNQITNYLKQGDLAKAQAVLLQGIESNAKGAAEAAASPMARLKNDVQEWAENIASKAQPALAAVAGFLTDKVFPRVQQIADALGPHIQRGLTDVRRFIEASLIPRVRELADWFGPRIQAAIRTIRTVLADILPTVISFATWAGPKLETGVKAAGSAFDFLVKALKNPAVQAFLVGILAIVAALKAYQAIMVVVSTVTKAWAAVQAAFNLIMDANPIALIVLAVIGLAAALIYAYNHSKAFRDVVQAALHDVSAAFNWLKTAAIAVFGWLKDHWVLVAGIVLGPIALIVGLIITHWTTIKSATETVWNTIVGVFKDAVAWITGYVNLLIKGLKLEWQGIVYLYDLAKTVVNEVVGIFSAIVGWVRSAIHAVVQGAIAEWNGIVYIYTYVSGVISNVIGAFRSIVATVTSIAGDIVTGFVSGLSSVWHKVTDWIGQQLGKLPAAIKSIFGISSPSTVMASIGANIVQGLIVGLTGSSATLRSAVGAMADLVTTGLSVSPTVDLTATRATTSAAPLSVTINVPPTTDPAEVGRQVSKVLQAHATATGRTLVFTP